LGLKLPTDYFVQKCKDALVRMAGNLAETNIKGCFNNSIDLTRASDFVGFSEGVFLGGVLEGIFNNFNEMIRMYEYKIEDIEPVKKKIAELLDILGKSFPAKNEKAKAELYDALVSTRSCVTSLQVVFYREKKMKPPPEPSFDA
jgi:hypothetical protein